MNAVMMMIMYFGPQWTAAEAMSAADWPFGLSALTESCE